MADKTDHPPIEIVKSANRTRTASARLIDGKVVVRVPARASAEEIQRLVETLLPRVLKAERKRTRKELPDLKRRAAEINRQYFKGKLTINEIRWVTNQQKRYGSCTPSTRTIRISDRVAAMPPWVLDYVIMHELAHLLQANHSSAFWELVARYPLTERARGYLIAMSMEDDTGPAEEDFS